MSSIYHIRKISCIIDVDKQTSFIVAKKKPIQNDTTKNDNK
jgi:hypothetical protein